MAENRYGNRRAASVRNAQAKREGQAFSLIESFKCAFDGVGHTIKTQRNIKVQIGFALAAMVLGIAFSIDTASWLAIVICMGLVLGLECVNTALEAAIDLASPGYHDLAKHAKDCAAGGVLVASLVSLVVAAIVFLPKIVGMFV